MPKLITQAVLDAAAPGGIWRQRPTFRVIREAGEWSNAAFELMKNEFSEDVLDPKERLETWLEETRAGAHEFPFLWAVAFIEQEGQEYLLGTFDGNLMPLVDWSQHDNSFHAPLMQDGSCIFVVGRQVTARAVRESEASGVGRGLFDFSVRQAQNMAESQKWNIGYFVLESEERSKGFWNKMGFLWPENTTYIQPPLEFDETTGQPVRQIVEETLMFRPTARSSAPTTIPPTLVRDTIATIYTYWSMHPFRKKMKLPENQTRPGSPGALRAAEELVMKELLGRVERVLPQAEKIRLVPARD